VSGPSNETEVEALLRRLVEATERIAAALEEPQQVTIYTDADSPPHVVTEAV
jgi:single-stranded DNA-specific DHH superfamily exonuclease